MEKTELVETLKSCREALLTYNTASESYQEVKVRLDDLNREPKLLKPPPERYSAPLAVVTFGVTALTCVCVCLSDRIQEMLSTGKLWVLAACIGLILSVGLSWFVRYSVGRMEMGRRRQEVALANQERRNDWNLRKKIYGFSYQQELDQEETRMEEAQKTAREYAERCGLHPRYQRAEILKYIIYYLESGRSDTLKDALNLYEMALDRYWEKEREYRYRQMLERLIRIEFQRLRQELGKNSEAVDRAAEKILSAVRQGGEKPPKKDDSADKNKET